VVCFWRALRASAQPELPSLDLRTRPKAPAGQARSTMRFAVLDEHRPLLRQRAGAVRIRVGRARLMRLAEPATAESSDAGP
jgi:hypothetical protein